MVTRTQIIEAAMKWDQTPYHHHGMVLGVGVDCAMLVAAVAVDSGSIAESDLPKIVNYPTQWHLHNREEKLLEQLESFGCVRKHVDQTKPGDIVTFKFGRTTSHLGIMINETQFIHARFDFKKVCVNTMNQEWIVRWTHSYEFPGVNNG